jgi:hypothetical protein
MDHQINKAHLTSGQAGLDLTFLTLKGAIQPFATMTKEDLLISIESLMTARGYNID